MVEEYEASQENRGPMAIRQIQDVPIIIQTSSTDTNRYVIEPQVVAVSIEGQSVLLETLDAIRIRVVADLTQQAGEEAFAVALEVEVPDDFAFRSCQPQSIPGWGEAVNNLVLCCHCHCQPAEWPVQWR